MAGYDGYSMSNNARMAYQGGYKPLSNMWELVLSRQWWEEAH
jgi:hypothetical protein